MKKLLFTLLIFLLTFGMFSCASKPKKANVLNEEVVLEDLSEEEQTILLKKQAEEELFNLDWTKKQSKNQDLAFGNIRLKSKKNNGTFNILVLNDSRKAIPVLSTANEYNSTSAFLKVGKRIIKLNQDSYIKTYSRKKNDGMQIAYVIEDTATVIIDFTCFSSDPENKDLDTVKITTAIKNTSKKRETFELKYILDTVLGETDRHHFYGPNAEPIKNEQIFNEMDEYKWFVSKNANASVVFNFEGLDAQKPAIIALSNYNSLNSTSWRPETSVSRAFGTVLSYNNSAVGVLWKPQKLSKDEYFTQTYYLTLSTDGTQIVDNPLIKQDSKDDDNTKKSSTIKKDDKSTKNSQNTVNTKEQISSKDVNSLQEEVKNQKEQKNSEQNKKQKKYSDKYIKELLQKINSLKDSDNVSSEELIRLNLELDQIMEEMRN